MSKEKLTLKQKIVERIENFFNRQFTLFWIILGVVVLVLIGIFVWNEIDKRVKQESASLVEEAQGKYAKWISESDEDKKAALEEELLADLSMIIKNYPDQYATQRALIIRGNLYYEKEEWQKAAIDYSDVANSFPKSFYAPIALFNAAMCYEETDEAGSAMGILTKLITSYKDSYNVPYALYTMGRISEQRGQNSDAEKYYTQLKEDYSYSNWSKLAQNRIIYLKIQGQ
ncbi:MAG: tetratricopeptide repeat protein [Spirochaetales bacterium]|nr:tetratricopeptide repeat protein [Spirochaetales bacterium]